MLKSLAMFSQSSLLLCPRFHLAWYGSEAKRRDIKELGVVSDITGDTFQYVCGIACTLLDNHL